MLQVRVKKRLKSFNLDIRFQAQAGAITALFGPSGAGKTSVVSMIAGLLRPDQGVIRLGGETLFDSGRGLNLPPEKRRIGYVFQEGRLFPHLSVRGNLCYGLRSGDRNQRRQRLEQVVELMGIGHLLSRRPATLSGGEKQRVAVGRALLTSPRLLLMDEPLASLDRARKEEVIPFLARLPRELAMPFIYVSHSTWELRQLGCLVIPIVEGRIEQGPSAGQPAAPGRLPSRGRPATPARTSAAS